MRGLNQWLRYVEYYRVYYLRVFDRKAGTQCPNDQLHFFVMPINSDAVLLELLTRACGAQKHEHAKTAINFVQTNCASLSANTCVRVSAPFLPTHLPVLLLEGRLRGSRNLWRRGTRPAKAPQHARCKRPVASK